MHLTKGPLDFILENNWPNLDRAGARPTKASGRAPTLIKDDLG
jgi:hypothetical protein